LWCSFKLWWNFCLDLLRSKFCLLRKWSIEWDERHQRLCHGWRLCYHVFLGDRATRGV
jgi:hypothetical protein